MITTVQQCTTPQQILGHPRSVGRAMTRRQAIANLLARFSRLLLVLLASSPALVQADFGTYVEAPQGGEWIRLASFTWESLPEDRDPKEGQQLDSGTFMSGRIAPQQGPAMVVLAKPVAVTIPGLSDHCDGGATLPVVRLDVPVWDTRFPTDDRYFQRYELQQVTVEDCQHLQGAVADALWLRFVSLKKEGEPRPLKQ